jgi:hypothetical protein
LLGSLPASRVTALGTVDQIAVARLDLAQRERNRQ